MNDNLTILRAAHDAWLAATDFRNRRDRYKRYTYGDQWSDMVKDDKGNLMSEYELASQSGRKPLTNNMIRQIVKTIVGRYRKSCDDNATYDSSRPSRRYVSDNSLAELDCRLLEEFLISGCAVQRISHERRSYGNGLWIDNVDPRMFFVNAFKDPRARDVELVGMLHDMSFPEIVARFGNSNRYRAAELARMFAATTGDIAFSASATLGRASNDSDDFFNPASGKCRVIEIWTLDCRRHLMCHDRRDATAYVIDDNERSRDEIATRNSGRRRDGLPEVVTRRRIDFTWHCRWMAPDGSLLAEYDSPFGHGSHPFAIKLYPMTDGEVHSLVEDVIDQQRYINRLIVLIDHMMGSSAKGVLLFPVDQLPKEYKWTDVSSIWSKSNGVIPITGRGNHLPQQVITSSANFGAYELLSLQMKLFENISGVGDALAGRNVSPTTGKGLYDSQVENSAIALADLLESFGAFREERDRKAENCVKKN